METKTFLEMRVNTDVYGELVPESLQETINEWYDSRHVCDNDNFVRFFQRILKRDYHRYNELLRIEAGAKYDTRAGYDWLVGSYLEREVKVDGETKESKTLDVTYKPEVLTTTDTISHIDFGSKSEMEHGLQMETTYGRKDETSGSSLTDSGTAASENGTSAQKATPASVVTTYTDSRQSDVSFDGSEVSVSLGVNGSYDAELNSPTAIAKTDSNSASRSIANSDTSSTNEASGKDTVKNSGVDSTEKSGRDTTTSSTTQRKSGEDTTSHVTDGEATSATTTHEIYTGRSSTPAEILVKARDYIESTSAWEWLRVQLEPCFMGVYDI